MFILNACNTDDAVTLTGNLRVVLKNGIVGNPFYELYTEDSWTALEPVAPLLQGHFTSSTVVIQDLNPGNYIFSIGGFHKQVQVTAGRVREHTF